MKAFLKSLNYGCSLNPINFKTLNPKPSYLSQVRKEAEVQEWISRPVSSFAKFGVS